MAGKPKVNHGEVCDATCENTSTHEQIHSTDHESRLKRDLGGAAGKSRYAREELVAKFGGLLKGNRLEIGSEIESHAAHLSH